MSKSVVQNTSAAYRGQIPQQSSTHLMRTCISL